jgi:hypothetical protein
MAAPVIHVFGGNRTRDGPRSKSPAKSRRRPMIGGIDAS